VLGVLETASRIRLPVECANVQQRLMIGEDRWVLWTFGPTRGPSVRFWSVLACSLLAGAVLGRLRLSPLPSADWMLLSIGLTQVPWPFACLVVSWLFVLVWRGRQPFLKSSWLMYNFFQFVILALTIAALVVLGVIVGQGLLGNPDMFIQGNGSTRTELSWYLARCGEALPQPGCVNISIWWYKLSMLVWALWLASALLNWLRKGWEQFSAGGCFRHSPRQTPPIPPSK